MGSYNDMDFIGFSFGGVHSDNLKIVRISEGSRYNLPLGGQITNTTITTPNGDGSIFFRSNISTKSYTIRFAFDDLNECDISALNRIFDGKEVKDLIFDEEPYKVYDAKVTGAPTLTAMCFEENEKARVYKGTGIINFICFEPYAHTSPVIKFVDGKEIDGKYIQYYNDIPNKNEEWKQYCKLLDANQSFPIGINKGEIPSPYIVTLEGEIEAGDWISIAGNKIIFQERCSNVTWNSKTGLIVGKVNDKERVVHFFGQSIHRLPITDENTDFTDYITKNENCTAAISIDYQFWYY